MPDDTDARFDDRINVTLVAVLEDQLMLAEAEILELRSSLLDLHDAFDEQEADYRHLWDRLRAIEALAGR